MAALLQTDGVHLVSQRFMSCKMKMVPVVVLSGAYKTI